MISLMPRSSQPSPDTAWRAVMTRDKGQDGSFVFAVTTTGIYCRPSCPARRPNRTNVRFFDTGRSARDAGFRACLRCHPDETRADPLAAAKALLDTGTGEPLTLERLADRVGLSPSHLQRTFKARFGLSPREYLAARRSTRLKGALRSARSVSRAGYDAGYGSGSRLYEGAAATLGMTPGRFARGGAGLALRYLIVDSALGRLLVAVSDRGVAAVLPGRADRELIAGLAAEFPNAELAPIEPGQDATLAALIDRVAAEVAGQASGPDRIPLDILGTAFQERVWKALQTIPAGATRSYQEVARTIGRPRATRAVASAIARNRLAVLVPCHRVVREDGSLGGYRWGLDTKRRLLDRERT